MELIMVNYHPLTSDQLEEAADKLYYETENTIKSLQLHEDIEDALLGVLYSFPWEELASKYHYRAYEEFVEDCYDRAKTEDEL